MTLHFFAFLEILSLFLRKNVSLSLRFKNSISMWNTGLWTGQNSIRRLRKKRWCTRDTEKKQKLQDRWMLSEMTFTQDSKGGPTNLTFFAIMFQMEEEKALKQLRRTLVPHARPVPNFGNPFVPQKYEYTSVFSWPIVVLCSPTD